MIQSRSCIRRELIEWPGLRLNCSHARRARTWRRGQSLVGDLAVWENLACNVELFSGGVQPLEQRASAVDTVARARSVGVILRNRLISRDRF